MAKKSAKKKPTKKVVEDTGVDFSNYVTIMLPNQPLMHEHDEYCWCAPEIMEDEDGNITEVIHRCPQ